VCVCVCVCVVNGVMDVDERLQVAARRVRREAAT